MKNKIISVLFSIAIAFSGITGFATAVHATGNDAYFPSFEGNEAEGSEVCEGSERKGGLC